MVPQLLLPIASITMGNCRLVLQAQFDKLSTGFFFFQAHWGNGVHVYLHFFKTGEQRVNQISTLEIKLSGLGELTEADVLLGLKARQ